MKRPNMESVMRVFARIDRFGPRQLLSELLPWRGFKKFKLIKPEHRLSGKVIKLRNSIARYPVEWTAATKVALDQGLLQWGNHNLQFKLYTEHRNGHGLAAESIAWAVYCLYLTPAGSQWLRDHGWTRPSSDPSRTAHNRQWVTPKSKWAARYSKK